MKTRRSFVSVLSLAGVLVLAATPSPAQQAAKQAGDLPIYYEELTSPEFVKAVARSESTCLVPLGILEKHGPHLPLGTDLLDVRELCRRAAQKEYSLIFPPYFVGQILEAKHQPGTIAYSPELMMKVLQETCDELARNGIKKIILVNGHGGNDQFVQYFCQTQLGLKKDYAVFLFDPSDDESMDQKLKPLRKTTLDGHAGEMETSRMLAHRPDLAHPDRADQQSGEDLRRLTGLKHAYTGIWWYARTPNHYLGNGTVATKELGETAFDLESDLLAEMVRSVKKDTVTLKLQKQFFGDSDRPLETKPVNK
jgi:creatinine amidohydrolase